jgi:gluconate 2-dehydrogenase gamma chain
MSLTVNRRRMLLAGALLGGVPAAAATAEVINGEAPWKGGGAWPNPVAGGSDYLYFTTAEAAFVEAASARMIPNDSLGPGAVEAGVPRYIDRQLAGDFGQGVRWYMQGPWAKGQPTQGYQSRMTPAAMYRAAIKAIDEATNTSGSKPFAQLAAADQDAFLKRLEKGDVQLSGGVDAKAFFDMFLQNVLEGFWSDPIYGGNKDLAGWKLIGFPGARYDNTPYVAYRGQAYPLPPVGLKGRPAWTRS